METKQVSTCTCTVIHADVVEAVKGHIISDDLSFELSSFFKVFSDPTRVKILSALFHSEMCVCDLANALDMTHSAISHQLRIFKAAKLVRSRKEGKVVYYALADAHIAHIFDQGLEHIQE